MHHRERTVGISNEPVHPSAAPIYYLGSNDQPAVLLLHGLTASPTEVRPVADYLREHEPTWTLSCPLLPGHGTKVEDLCQADMPMWKEAVTQELERLASASRSIIVVGVSLGAVLAADAALGDSRIAALVMLAPMFRLSLSTRLGLGALSLVSPFTKKSQASLSNHQTKGLFSYDRYPIASLQSLHQLGQQTLGRLDELTVPTLLAGGDRDRYQSWSTIQSIASRIRHSNVTLIRCENSGHVLPHEPDAEALNHAIHQFISETLA